MTPSRNLGAAVRSVFSDTTEGFLEIFRNTLALLGIAVACMIVVFLVRPDWRLAGEAQLHAWLQERQHAAAEGSIASEPEAIERATATNPKALPREQAAIAYWLSKKYKVAPEPLSVLVAEAYDIGTRTKLDPTLILAIMAIESNFNPFAQSAVGAQGLMQVMTRVHTEKYQNFGGHFAAFDPVSNLRVGVKVLQECIARAGSIEGGLRYYVGAASQPDDGGYTAKVMAEHSRLRQVANGRSVPVNAPVMLSTQAPAATPAQAVPAASRSAGERPSAEADSKVALLGSVGS